MNSNLQYKVLIAEDDESSFLYMLFALEELNCKIVRAVSGLEAINLFSASYSEFDFVIMDLKLPIIDGYQATDAIRKIRPDIKIILQTASYLPLIMPKLNEYKFDAVLSKPFSITQLIDAIKSISEKDKNISSMKILHDN